MTSEPAVPPKPRAAKASRYHDPFVTLAAIKCGTCHATLAYSNATNPTRTIKQYCSMSCASIAFDAPIRLPE